MRRWSRGCSVCWSWWSEDKVMFSFGFTQNLFDTARLSEDWKERIGFSIS